MAYGKISPHNGNNGKLTFSPGKKAGNAAAFSQKSGDFWENNIKRYKIDTL